MGERDALCKQTLALSWSSHLFMPVNITTASMRVGVQQRVHARAVGLSFNPSHPAVSLKY